MYSLMSLGSQFYRKRYCGQSNRFKRKYYRKYSTKDNENSKYKAYFQFSKGLLWDVSSNIRRSFQRNMLKMTSLSFLVAGGLTYCLSGSEKDTLRMEGNGLGDTLNLDYASSIIGEYSIIQPLHKAGYVIASVLALVRNWFVQREPIDLNDSTAEAVIRQWDEGIEPEGIYEDERTWVSLLQPSKYKPTLTVIVEANVLFGIVRTPEGYMLRKRPYTDHFIAALTPYAEIIIASTFHTKEAMINLSRYLDSNQELEYLTREDAILYRGRYAKPLDEFHTGRKVKRMVTLDHNLSECGDLCGNVLLFNVWKGRMDDTALLDIIPLLRYLAAVSQNDGDTREVIRHYKGIKDVPTYVQQQLRSGAILKDETIVPKPLERIEI